MASALISKVSFACRRFQIFQSEASKSCYFTDAYGSTMGGLGLCSISRLAFRPAPRPARQSIVWPLHCCLALRTVTEPSSSFRSTDPDDDLTLLPMLQQANAHALRAPFGNAMQKIGSPAQKARCPQFSACRLPSLRCGHRGNKIVIVTVSQLRMETNMIIGTFSYDKKTNSFKGDILTLSFQFSAVDITPHEKSGATEPDYRVTARTATGHVELGAAWKRTSDIGREFISVSLDAPLLAAPVYAVMFIAEDGKQASLVWSRLKSKANAEKRKKAA